MSAIRRSDFSVQRLVGGVFGSEGLLTARVRENQPFSVVLLDEFEKAHPQFLDLLLQVLGEGTLDRCGGATLPTFPTRS